MESLNFRKVSLDDAEGISDVLQEIAAAGKRTRPSDVGFSRIHYIAHPDSIQCTVAVQDTRVLGFQSLKLAVEDNPYEVKVGWGIIGTHIRPSSARLGIGRALFQETLSAARASGIPAIDATISAKNAEGLAYYDAMGFVDYKQHTDAVSKIYRLR
ncbi:GNAT family N-acetyltransferase [Ruegeria lacuscaerulensis]|uniref:GNAT family N-acetyltransferase n=1 Tax=Ruegeria lacuscaerulensis TaxID=55218 RepID=UPI00148181E0|nr:GNAT family N-acetyltransferase [Ruegeria lacuscaerulensis]